MQLVIFIPQEIPLLFDLHHPFRNFNIKKDENAMIEYVHKHITSELNQNTRTDTIFILTSIFLNLITLAVNSAMSKESRTNSSTLTQ